MTLVKLTWRHYGDIGHGDHDESVFVDSEQVVGVDQFLPSVGRGWMTRIHLRSGTTVECGLGPEQVIEALEAAR